MNNRIREDNFNLQAIESNISRLDIFQVLVNIINVAFQLSPLLYIQGYAYNIDI